MIAMNSNRINSFNLFVVLAISIMVAGVLSLVDLPDWLFYFRPDWIALVLIFWVLVLPERLSVGYGLISGLFLDLILVKPLGLNAIGFVLLAYLVSYWSSQIRALTLWQQCLFLVVLLAACKLVIGIIAVLATDFVFTHFYWYSAFGNMVFWPLLYMILQEVKQAFLRPNVHD